jgi:hypothetical protein
VIGQRLQPGSTLNASRISRKKALPLSRSKELYLNWYRTHGLTGLSDTITTTRIIHQNVDSPPLIRRRMSVGRRHKRPSGRQSGEETWPAVTGRGLAFANERAGQPPYASRGRRARIRGEKWSAAAHGRRHV